MLGAVMFAHERLGPVIDAIIDRSPRSCGQGTPRRRSGADPALAELDGLCARIRIGKALRERLCRNRSSRRPGWRRSPWRQGRRAGGARGQS